MRLELPRVAPVQLAAFAHDLRCFATEAEYDASQAEAELKYAVESIIPSGLFVEEGELPAAYAMFTGRVLDTHRRTNPFADGAFWWARVATLGGELDVVADPSVVEGELMGGGIVHGTFWLSGRLPTSLAGADQSFWRRWRPR